MSLRELRANFITKIWAVTLTTGYARCPARREGGRNARASSELERSSAGDGAMVGQASKGAGKYVRLPFEVCSISKITSPIPDRTGANYSFGDFGQLLAQFPSIYWTFLVRVLGATA